MIPTSSERKPTTESSLLARPLVAITRLCVRNPVSVLALALALSVFGVIAATENLGFKTSRLDLINPKSGFNRLWLEYIKEFGDNDDLIIVVEGSCNADVAPVLDHLSDKIVLHPRLFQSVLHGIDVSKIREKGLHYVPADDLKTVCSFAKEAGNITRGQWAQLNIGNTLDSLCFRIMRPEEVLRGSDPSLSISPEQLRGMTLHQLDLAAQSLAQAFSAKPTYDSPWPQMQGYLGMPEVVAACSQHDTGYFILPGKDGEGAMGFVLVRIAESDRKTLAYGTEAIEKLRELIREAQDHFPDLQIGLTGLPVMENDEMRLSQTAMNKASVLSFIGVVCVFVAGFGGFRHPLMAVVALLLAFGWTAGYILLSVGHLNILSISFGVILIGLGTDFSVHYISRYMQVRKTVRSPQEAIMQTAGVVGPGVLTGAFTTAVAFFMAGFAEFTGIVELGIISGGGILLCGLATVLIVPAFIQLIDGPRPMRRVPQPVDTYAWVKPLFRFPKLTLLVCLVGTGFLLTGLPKVWYDHNLLNLQPEGLESVELEKKLLQCEGQNVWYALSIADSQEALLQRKEEFQQRYPELQVAEIVSMIPGYDARKQPYIGQISKLLENLPERPPVIPLSPPDKIGHSLAQLQTVLENTPNAHTQRIIRNLNEVRQALRGMSVSDCYRRMQDYQNAVAGDLLSRLHILRGMANPNPPEWGDLPEPFVSQFISKGGKHLMRIYTRGDLWDMDELESFVNKVRSIDPKATGAPLQTYEASLQMQKGYQSASIYAFVGIFILLLIDFRSLKDTFISLIPMTMGMGQMLGILGLLGIPLNPANMIAIPLVLGIGIDDGVHITHDFRAQKGRFRMNPSTASSIVITTLTTVIGFGSLMIASHQGLQSLGRVLVIGISCCMFSSLVVLPALLVWWTKNRPDVADDAEETAGDVEQARALARQRRFLREDQSHSPNRPDSHKPKKGLVPGQGEREAEYDPYYAEYHEGEHVPVFDPLYDQQYVDQPYSESDDYVSEAEERARIFSLHPQEEDRLGPEIPDSRNDKPKRLRRRHVA